MRCIIKESLEEVWLQFDSGLYSPAALHMAAGLLANRYLCVVEPAHEGALRVVLRPKQGVFDSASNASASFIECLQDAQMRVDVEDQVRPIRELIIRKALAPVAALSGR